MNALKFETRAIIRDFIPGNALFIPGKTVLTTASAFSERSPDSEFLFMLEARPELSIRCSPEKFMDFRNYLSFRRSVKEFWFLMHRQRFSSDDLYCCVNWRDRVTFESRPFRFESMGELYYFAEDKKLKMNDYMIGHSECLKLPQFLMLRR